MRGWESGRVEGWKGGRVGRWKVRSEWRMLNGEW